ncbi:MAG TPA: hypothetical protein VJJ26_01915 [Candidatus Babeliales bacterium]|nr:hypothetical protein [Candidatus Babeliales bacterium]
MKKVNFIASLSPQKQYEIRRWFWMTVLLSACAFMIGTCFIVPQLLLYVSLKKEVSVLREKTKNYADVVKNKGTLKTEYETLRTREGKINAYSKQQKNPYLHITSLVEASGNGVQLESVRFNKKDVEVVMVCPTSEHANVFVKRLSVLSNFSHVKMTSLQHDAQTKSLRCTIKGHVIF